MVEHLVANQMMGVRFSLPAQNVHKTWTAPGFVRFVARSGVRLASRTASGGRDRAERARREL